MDMVIYALLSVAFATLVTVHIVIAVRLLLHKPRYRGVIVLVVLPLAPWWAHAAKWRRLSALWLISVILYALARAAASI